MLCNFEKKYWEYDIISIERGENVMKKRLYRTKYNTQIGGVCNGLSEYFDCDVSIVRIFFVLFALFLGNGILFYFILWIILPVKYSYDEKME